LFFESLLFSCKAQDEAVGAFFGGACSVNEKTWKNHTKIFKMGIDKFAQIMYNEYNGRIWGIFRECAVGKAKKG
jgi:hypothetical protein